MKTLALLVLLPLAGQAAPAVTSEIRLDRDGGSMVGLPISDQRDLGICYAFAAAQALNAYRFSHGDARRDFLISPHAIALSSLTDITNWNEGGSFSGAIEEARTGAACSVAQMEPFVPLKPRMYEGFFSQLKRAFLLSNKYWRTQSPEAALAANPGWSFAQTSFAPLLTPQNRDAFTQVSEKIFRSDIDANYDYPQKDFSAWPAAQLFAAVCHTPENDFSWIPHPKLETLRFDERYKKLSPQKQYDFVKAYISRHLALPNPQPVAITLSGPHIGEVLGRDYKQAHAVLIIGERTLADGSKLFLMRNSWGPEWCPADPRDPLCEGGQAWFPERKIVPAISELASLGE